MKNNINDNPDTNGMGVVYELWCEDTFERHTFLCDVFDSYAEALAALERCRRGALKQDEELRDTYWLVRSDAAHSVSLMQATTESLEDYRKVALFCQDHLHCVCEQAIDKFLAFVQKNKECPLLSEKVTVEWNHPDDCFYEVSFSLQLIEDLDIFCVDQSVGIRSTQHYGRGNISVFVLALKGTIDDICSKLQDAEIRRLLFNKACQLIEDYFEKLDD
ncbi:MAG: hypothetical protein IJS30_06325 [Bacteroidales bacterium]|nr:hypothetical protein [Bacteroidales bacterium]